jgi:hypothetical protein
MLAHVRPLLFVLDPLQAFLGPNIDMHRANEVRPLMTNLLALAQAFDCGVMPCVTGQRAWMGAPKIAGRGTLTLLRQRVQCSRWASRLKVMTCASWRMPKARWQRVARVWRSRLLTLAF